MIYQSLHCLTEEINRSLKRNLKITDDKVLLSSIVNQDGSVAVQGENKIILTLINVEKESAKTNANQPVFSKTSPGYFSTLCLNLQVMFSAYFPGNSYPEGLQFLSLLISFMQEKPVFNRSNTPSLPAGIGKLSFEMETIGVEKLNNVWAMLGAKYMPSAIYKIRMLTFDGIEPKEYRPVASNASGGVLPVN